MMLKAIRNVMPSVALASGLACLAFGVLTTFFFTGKFHVRLFWLSLTIAFAAALISLPRRNSLLGLALLAFAYVWSGGGASYGHRTTFPSPDGRYKLVVYARPMSSASPGQGSDAPGYVQLQDQSGRVLEGGYVEVVQNAYEVEWRADEVEVGPHGDGRYTWRLPR